MQRSWVALMYHDIAPGSVGPSGGKEHFSVPVRKFREQLDMIHEMGFEGRSLEEVLDGTAPGRIAITFDDADAGQYTHGFPELIKRGMTATFFVVTDWVGQSGYAGWDQLRKMKMAGMSIQSHTRTHPFLSNLDEGALRDELCASKSLLDAKLDQDTSTLAFPGGDPPRRSLRALVAAAGYRFVATSTWGVNRVRWQSPEPRPVRRCTIRGEVASTRFRRILEGDRALGASRQARDGFLRMIRRALGPNRYAEWRRAFLNKITVRDI